MTKYIIVWFDKDYDVHQEMYEDIVLAYSKFEELSERHFIVGVYKLIEYN